MNKALEEVRAGESRRMASESQTPLLKKSRWLLLKREENLKAEQHFRLREGGDGSRAAKDDSGTIIHMPRNPHLSLHERSL